MLYPLKFKPVFKETVWGGTRLGTILGKKLPSGASTVGESWELCDIAPDFSVVQDGIFKGNTLGEMAEIYMDELLGEKVYEKFGHAFPLLVKFIDAQQDLSIQVHPNDEVAAQRHDSPGKTEMWYVVDAAPGSKLYVGFNQPVDAAKYSDYLCSGRLEELMCAYEVTPGDVFFIPAGIVHAIGEGCLIAEIQQSSDITYRLYDYNRTDSEGKLRELHTDLAMDVIDFEANFSGNFKLSSKKMHAEFAELLTSDYFCSSILGLKGELRHDFSVNDSFTILMCIDGEASVCWGFEASGAGEGAGRVVFKKGETMLLPASLGETVFSGSATILATYIK